MMPPKKLFYFKSLKEHGNTADIEMVLFVVKLAGSVQIRLNDRIS